MERRVIYADRRVHGSNVSASKEAADDLLAVAQEAKDAGDTELVRLLRNEARLVLLGIVSTFQGVSLKRADGTTFPLIDVRQHIRRNGRAARAGATMQSDLAAINAVLGSECKPKPRGRAGATLVGDLTAIYSVLASNGSAQAAPKRKRKRYNWWA